MLVLGLFLCVVSALCFLLLNQKQRDTDSIEQERSDTRALEHPFLLPSADEGAVPHFAFIDVQTNGLHCIDGTPPDLLQICWIVTDKEYRVILTRTRYILQKDLGPSTAQKVHKITKDKLIQEGESERRVLEDFIKECGEVPHWVFHHAAFDLSVLEHAWAKQQESLSVGAHIHCTMMYRSLQTKQSEKYPSLLELSSDLLGYSSEKIERMDIVAWRNACLTRLVYKRLASLYDPATEEAKA